MFAYLSLECLVSREDLRGADAMEDGTGWDRIERWLGMKEDN